MDQGGLSSDRLESYLKLQEEIAVLETQQGERLEIEDKRRSRVTGKTSRARLKGKGRD